uniref:Cryptochrome/DNA photolyase FAD-binding domain-containing protein n=2 Tax=Zea mays TaxID=4577 RepID=A0A804LH65_MAIZE
MAARREIGSPSLAHPALRSRRPAKSRNPRPKSRNPPPLWKEIASGPPLRPNSRSASSSAFAAPWLSVLHARALDPRHRAPIRHRAPPRAIPTPSPRSTRLRQSRLGAAGGRHYSLRSTCSPSTSICCTSRGRSSTKTVAPSPCSHRCCRPFTMFWNRCLCMPDPAAPLLPPKRINSGDLSRCPWDELVFEDESERGSNALLARAWSPGWQNADKALTAFLNGPLMDHSVNRKKADSASTSLLSPYLHFGELSVRKVFHQVRMKRLMWSNDD